MGQEINWNSGIGLRPVNLEVKVRGRPGPVFSDALSRSGPHKGLLARIRTCHPVFIPEIPTFPLFVPWLTFKLPGLNLIPKIPSRRF